MMDEEEKRSTKGEEPELLFEDYTLLETRKKQQN